MPPCLHFPDKARCLARQFAQHLSVAIHFQDDGLTSRIGGFHLDTRTSRTGFADLGISGIIQLFADGFDIDTGHGAIIAVTSFGTGTTVRTRRPSGP